jgi:hypothetical protein
MKVVKNGDVNPDKPFRYGEHIRHIDGGTICIVRGYEHCSKGQHRACGKECGNKGLRLLYQYIGEGAILKNCLFIRDWHPESNPRFILAYKSVKHEQTPIKRGEFARVLKRKHINPLLVKKTRR